jgi:hypothetical protein
VTPLFPNGGLKGAAGAGGGFFEDQGDGFAQETLMDLPSPALGFDFFGEIQEQADFFLAVVLEGKQGFAEKWVHGSPPCQSSSSHWIGGEKQTLKQSPGKINWIGKFWRDSFYGFLIFVVRSRASVMSAVILEAGQGHVFLLP